MEMKVEMDNQHVALSYAEARRYKAIHLRPKLIIIAVVLFVLTNLVGVFGNLAGVVYYALPLVLDILIFLGFVLAVHFTNRYIEKQDVIIKSIRNLRSY